MRTLLSSDRLRPTLLLYRSINPKPFSSQSPIQPISQLKPPNPIPNQNDAVDDDANVIRTLLGRKNDPVSALEYCNWVRPHNRHGGDLFWVLIHILVTSPHTHHRANNLLVLFVSANPHLSPSVTATQLLDSAQRFGLGPDPRAFNYLLNAYIRNKRVNDAVECFKLMVERKFVPFVCYVNSVLSSLVRSNEIGEAKEVYRKMVEVGVSGDNVTAQLLMRGCLRERKPEEALRIFKRVVRGGRDALMYSLAVQAACKVNDLELGLGLLREMREELGVCGSQETYTSVVVACVKGGKVGEAVRVKDEMVGFGIPVSVVAATSLVSGYCKEGEFCKALELFEVVEGAPDKVMFSVMIEWCCRKGVVEKAVEVYKRMRVAGITPSSVVVHMVIKACLRGESPETALEIFDDGYEMGVADGYVCNTILQLLCKQGKVDAGRSLMKVMEDRGIEINVVSYNNMMLAHCRMKDMELARSVYSVMLEKGLEPTNFTYSILIDGFFKNRDEESACDVINQMISRNFEASEVVYNTIINGLCKVGQTSKAREMLQELVKEKRYSFSCMSYNSIIDGFFREGETDSAVETYREMTTSENGVSPNVVTFTSLINGFCKSGRMDLVLEMRQEMERKDVKLDVPAYGALIDGFCKKQDMKTAVSLFSELVELGLVPNVSVYNSLISGFRNVGDMVAAVDLYKKMVSDGVKCDLFTYTTLIDGLLKDGDLISASGLYSEVVALGMVPDEVLLVVLVNGLSKKGQFLKASKMLEELKRRGDVTPNVLIYTSVIAGHYREGSLDKAFQIQEEMIEKGLEYDHAVFDLLVSGKVEKTHAACSQG